MGRGAGRRRLPDQHANRAARTSHFLTVLLMPRCLVKHSLHPVHGVFCTLSAYFSGVFLSECLWDAVSSQPSALGARAECGTALPDLPGAGPASSRMERTEEPSPWALPKNAAALGLSCHSLVLTAHSPCPAQVPRATKQPHQAPGGHQRKVGKGNFSSHPRASLYGDQGGWKVLLLLDNLLQSSPEDTPGSRYPK